MQKCKIPEVRIFPKCLKTKPSNPPKKLIFNIVYVLEYNFILCKRNLKFKKALLNLKLCSKHVYKNY